MTTGERSVELHKRKFIEFMGADEYEGKHLEKIRQCIHDKKFRMVMNINELRSREPDLVADIIRRPREYMIALQEAATETARSLDPSFEKVLINKELQVGFEGSFGSNSISARGLNSRMLNTLVEVEGIIVKCSSVRPKLVRSVSFCPKTNQYTLREYRDASSMDIGIEVRENGGEKMPTSAAIPTKDQEGNPLELEPGLCVYKDYQSIVLQEMPEKSRVGQLPRSVDVVLEHDLVDRVKPGDRILCVGVYRSLPFQTNGQTTGLFRTVLMCNNISIIGKEVGAVRLTGTDVKNIRDISHREDILSVMARSLCPSIFGHDYIKKALILQLLGGCERLLENGHHLRGDINIMLVGDPSTAKSQLLRAVLDIAPLAISTTGRGSSGVGLTAAVTSDPETGERRLEAGAMVLADRGVVCIDEFDKMNEIDRVAIHEVMEQQTVTIAKAGIHASLNAHCSVLAAANPVYGQYDKTRRPQENIGLPDSLLSRFDLLFIVLDQLDPVFDRRLAEHVVRSHQYRRPGTIMEPEAVNQASSSLGLDDTMDTAAAVDSTVWQRIGKATAQQEVHGADHKDDILTKEFLRKYIHFAKNRIQPVLSNEAMDQIAQAYTAMRAHQSHKNLHITARTLETLIRLSSAAAKSRLSDTVDSEDVDVAVELMNFVLFHEIGVGADKPQQVKGAPSKEQQKPASLTQLMGELLSRATIAGQQVLDKADIIAEMKTVYPSEDLENEIESVLLVMQHSNRVSPSFHIAMTPVTCGFVISGHAGRAQRHDHLALLAKSSGPASANERTTAVSLLSDVHSFQLYIQNALLHVIWCFCYLLAKRLPTGGSEGILEDMTDAPVLMGRPPSSAGLPGRSPSSSWDRS